MYRSLAREYAAHAGAILNGRRGVLDDEATKNQVNYIYPHSHLARVFTSFTLSIVAAHR